MTKDYKNVPRSSDQKTTKRAPKKNASTTKKNSSTKKPTPGWVWMLAGLAIGLSVAAIVYFYDRGDETVKTATKVVSDAIKAVPKPQLPEKNAASEKDDDPRFDFYTLLPELEVLIPESEIKEEQARIKEKNNIAYMIQVGSFRAYGEADSLKAQMAMLGIEADIDPVSSKGEQWLRVRVGPFTDKRELNKIRNRLHKNNINTMLVQIKK